ncbi:MAG: polysaccharide export protein [Candidatus Lindowbacteria bacterium]|nr:polysaccharide export protein [Candidatus Lindowbacteria bacterium]
MRARVFLALVFLGFMVGCASATGKPAAGVEVQPSEFAAKPASLSDFRLGTGDKITVLVYRNEELNRTVTVGPTGIVYLPLVGEVDAMNKSLRELRVTIEGKLAEYIVSPQVNIEVTSSRSQKVFVLGEVSRPGVFVIEDNNMTAIEAITMAGGFTPHAYKGNVILIRGELSSPKMTRLNMTQTLKMADLSLNPYLQRGDIVYVPSYPISDIAKFANYVDQILSPVVELERGISLYPVVEDALHGERAATGVNTVIIGAP